MSGPLSGLHILDLSTYVAGPSATLALAQLGADVVRVDPVGGATDTRRLPRSAGGTSLYWAGLNKGKRSVEVDLRSESGRDIVRSLLAAPGSGHGLLVTNAVGQEWLGYEKLKQVRPDVIVVHIAGRGDGRPAVDYTINSEVGLPWLTGPVDSSLPVNHVLPAWDLLTGLHIALALLAAHAERVTTGRGRLVEVNLADVAAATMAHLGFVADAVVNGSGRLRDGNYLYGSYGCDFATADGRRVMVVALTARHWDKLVELTGTHAILQSLQMTLRVDFGEEAARYEHRDLISAILAPWFSAHTHAGAVAALDAGHVLWGDYRTIAEFVSDPIVTANDLFHQVDQPGVGSFPVPGLVTRSPGWGQDKPAPAPQLGADNDAVVREWLQVEDWPI
ncbi:CoA transferase [Dactylosporangium sp. NPDC005572]|uniref:CoA transferase n=1 Tax=Dactylosporangium sp. NPDC005572 TaxID=3156889 RepID=UPI0033B70EB7